MPSSSLLTDGGGEGRDEGTPTTAQAPRILSFRSAEPTIHIGYPTIFTWEVEGAERITLSGGIGEVSGRSFAEAYLTEPGLYRLTASNQFASVVAAVELALPLPDIQSFFAGGYQIRPGLPTSLFWEVSDATELILAPPHEPVTDLRRIEVLPDCSTTYELIARNASGEVRRSLTLTLPPPSILAFEGDSVSTEGEPIELRWAVEYAHRVTIEPQIGEVAPHGHLRVRPSAPFTKYQLCAEGHSGTAYASFEVVRFPIPIELEDDLDTQLDTLLTMAEQPPEQQPPMILSPEQPPRPPESPPEAHPATEQPPTEDPRIRRVQEMELAPELLDMQKAHVRTEVVNALRKIKRLLKRKLTQP